MDGEGPNARYSILVDDRETSALRMQLVPLDARTALRASLPERPPQPRSSEQRDRQKAALPLGTAANRSRTLIRIAGIMIARTKH